VQLTLDERLLVIWGGSPIVWSRDVKTVLEQAGDRIRLKRLPGYAPPPI